jgi:uracil-DNA glycosylase
LDDFLDRLAAVEVADDAFNPYGVGNPFNAVRRENLRLYLEQMKALRPSLLLVGEAPGYLGARRTGLPFCSEHMLLHPPEGLPLFGTARGYRLSGEFDGDRKEPSGTVFWTTLAGLGIVPLVWASFPFHPHRPGKPMSNRAPRTSELKVGQPFLQAVMGYFDVREIVAIGNKADESLTDLGIPHQKVRHPSQGGKPAFVAGMQALAARHR